MFIEKLKGESEGGGWVIEGGGGSVCKQKPLVKFSVMSGGKKQVPHWR